MSVVIALVGISVVFAIVIAFFVWRLFGTANKSVQAVAGIMGDALGTVKPIAAAAGSTLDGVARGVHAGADMLNVLTESMRDKQKVRAQLAEENVRLRAEIDTLKARRIEATSVKQILEVAFFEMASTYTSFERKDDKVSDGGAFGFNRPTHNEYVGVLTANYSIKAGINLDQITFGFNPAGKAIRFHGAHVVQFVGLRDLKITRSFQEARLVYQSTDLREGRVEVLQDSRFLKSAGDKHYDEVVEGIQKTDLASALADANQVVARSLFESILGSGRYAFLADESPQPLSFNQLVKELNAEVGERRAELERAEADLQARTNTIDDEILSLVLSARSVDGAPQIAGAVTH